MACAFCCFPKGIYNRALLVCFRNNLYISLQMPLVSYGSLLCHHGLIFCGLFQSCRTFTRKLVLRGARRRPMFSSRVISLILYPLLPFKLRLFLSSAYSTFFCYSIEHTGLNIRVNFPSYPLFTAKCCSTQEFEQKE
jgi:hypothetical protein